MSGYFAAFVIGTLICCFGFFCRRLDDEPENITETYGVITDIHTPQRRSPSTYYQLDIAIGSSVVTARTVSYASTRKLYKIGDRVRVGAYMTKSGLYWARIRDSRLVRASEDASRAASWICGCSCLFIAIGVFGIVESVI